MLFFFKSSRKADKCSVITIKTATYKRALVMAIVSFNRWGYKGSPVCINKKLAC